MVPAKTLIGMHASRSVRISDSDRFWVVEHMRLFTANVIVVQETFTVLTPVSLGMGIATQPRWISNEMREPLWRKSLEPC